MSKPFKPASLLENPPGSARRIAILGSTGSIGISTLKIVEAYPERFSVTSLAAGRNVDAVFEQVRKWQPKLVSMATDDAADELRKRLGAAGLNVQVLSGSEGAVEVATHPEANFVVSAIVGVAGLEATYEAVRAGKSVGLANKECLVAAGELITTEARRQGKPLLPIDSEHNAVHQCMRGATPEEVGVVWLTASGGPFLNTPKSHFGGISVDQALNHPTWKEMGKRITIDSATLMNKGFEVIEACRLFDLAPDRVKVIVHPQSTIHSLVEFRDGSVLAQLSVTDMRLPILYALTYPERLDSELKFDLMSLKKLDFCPPDMEKFPCLGLAYEAASTGGAKTIALNAADEVAVAAFLDGVIGFEDIPRTIKKVLGETSARHPESIKEVLQMDAEARTLAAEVVESENSLSASGRGVHSMASGTAD